MKKIRVIALVLCLVMSVSLFAGCGQNSKNGKSGNIEIKIGYWPNKDTDPQKYEIYMGYVEEYAKIRPDVTIIPDEMNYDNNTFTPLAAAGQLPNMYRVPFTEPKNVMKAGYARDVDEIMKERGYAEKMNEDVLNIVTGTDGKLYGIPNNGYMMGMWYNVNLFEKAGLVKSDGTIDYPQTWDEVIKVAKIITEKTGQAGFAFQCKDAEAGWNLMNIAWSYGVSFMELQEDGKYKATFASQEMVDTLQYISDLKWKYNVIPANVLIGRGDIIKLFATDQLAMSICAEDWLNSPVKQYNMDKSRIGTSAMPAGPKGRIAQTGGDVWMFSKETTDEQLDALFDWLELIGDAPELSDIAKTNIENKIKAQNENGNVIIVPAFSVWKDEDRNSELAKLYEPYVNTDEKVQNKMMNDDVSLHAEEPASTQELYRVISDCMQAVLTNKNVDIMSMLKEKQTNFQKDFLDK